MKRFILLCFSLFLFSCDSKKVVETQSEQIIAADSHVHLMSPFLIEYWKKLGIPFSRSEANYSNIDTILKNVGAQKIDLIGMGYVYGNPEYYQGDDALQRMADENDFLFTQAKKHPKRVTPFFTVDPLKENAIEELKRCLQYPGKKGLKLHFNASQVYLTEPEHVKKVLPIFEMAAENHLPVLLHFDNWHPKFGATDLMILNSSILSEIPPINLRIAHFGTSGGFNEKTKGFLDEFLEMLKEGRIPEKHKVLLDISAVALDKNSEGVKKLTDLEFEELKTYVKRFGTENIVFGTDYPLYGAKEYREVLKNKLGLNDSEIKQMIQNCN